MSPDIGHRPGSRHRHLPETAPPMIRRPGGVFDIASLEGPFFDQKRLPKHCPEGRSSPLPARLLSDNDDHTSAGRADDTLAAMLDGPADNRRRSDGPLPISAGDVKSSAIRMVLQGSPRERSVDGRLIIKKSAPTHTRDGQSANADNCEFGRFLDRGVAHRHS